jgi:hypothetical protein
MEIKVASLEHEISLMKITFVESIVKVQNTATENQNALMQIMEKCLGKRSTELLEGSLSGKKDKTVMTQNPEKSLTSVATNFNALQGDAWDEFR